jgi:hypothetical protein
MESTEYKNGDPGSHLIRRLAKVNKKLQAKTIREREKFLTSELSDNKVYRIFLQSELEKLLNILKYEKEFPSGPDYPIYHPAELSLSEPVDHQETDKIPSVNHENKLPASPKYEKANIFCPSMPLSVPRNHFKLLTEHHSKNGKPYLTRGQLDSFIDRAFCGNPSQPVQKINLDLKGETIKIQNVFYAFYCNTVKNYFPTDNCRDKFIRLLTDHFAGWDFNKVKKNFSKHTKHCFEF